MTDKKEIGPGIAGLLQIMARLRDPESGCPWDVEQTFRSIVPYTIEEAYEVADAIEHDDMMALKDELGDLLLQVVFHARMAEEDGAFGFQDVAQAIADKMVRRHPHVFGGETERSAEAQTRKWEEIKAAERAENGADDSVLAGVALGLPGLTRAQKLQKRAARVGFDWPHVVQVFDKIEEEITEIKEEIAAGAHPDRCEDEVGDLLFVVANLARHLGVDPEAAVRRSNGKFERRFRALELQLGDGLAEADLRTMEQAWQDVKATEPADY